MEKTEHIDYSIEKGNCNPGFDGGKKKKEEPEQWVYFAFEDLGTTADYDFNDVVVRIGVPDATTRQSVVELCAIGGRLTTKIFCDGQQIGEEVHTYGQFGTNTFSFSEMPLANLGKVNVPEGTSVADLNINIQVTMENGQVVTVSGPEAGEVPFRVVVSGDENGKWFWPVERICISDAYLQFGTWGADMDANPDWYKTPKDENVIKW